MAVQKFKSRLEKAGSWTIVKVPFDAKKIFGSAGHTRIMGTLDGLSFKGLSLMPMGEGRHCFPVKAEMRKAIGKDAGDPVTVVLEKDPEKPVVEVPLELKEAFRASKEAKKMFGTYSASMQLEHCRYIAEGKKKETRESRAIATVLRLEKRWSEKKK
jgi:hypothetical protein